MIGVLKKISDITYEVGKWIMFAYILGVTVLAILGVIFRMTGNSLSWNEELMRWLLIGSGYIGASVALRERTHVGIEFFIMRMGRNARKISILIGYLTIVIFLVVAIWYGFDSAMRAQRQFGAILRLPMVWVKLNIPLGSLFMLIHMTYFSAGLLTEKEDYRKYLVSGGQEFGGEK